MEGKALVLWVIRISGLKEGAEIANLALAFMHELSLMITLTLRSTPSGGGNS